MSVFVPAAYPETVVMSTKIGETDERYDVKFEYCDDYALNDATQANPNAAFKDIKVICVRPAAWCCDNMRVAQA
jgi:hypothetical protein